ncbi:tetratricopeptide repeat protein [Ahniella affigens]|nr:hypothetical protein [Ahniella affigens]
MEFWQECLKRRVPHLLLAYLGSVWAGTEVITFVVGRYGFADIWVDRFLVSALSVLPAVVWTIWRVGADGAMSWRGRDIGITVGNLTLAVGLAVAVPGRAPPDAAPSPENTTTPVAKSTVPQLKPGLLIGGFRNLSDGGEGDELAFAIPGLLETDLLYEPSFNTTSFIANGPRGIAATFASQGILDPRQAETGAWRLVASSLRMQAVVTGKVLKSVEGFELQLAMTRWRPQEVHEEVVVKAGDPIALIDQAGAAVRAFMVGTGVTLSGEDPPLSSISSEQWPVLRDYARARDAVELHNQSSEGLPILDSVLSRAPTFAYARWTRMLAFYQQGQRDLMMTEISRLMRQLPQLPVSARFQVQLFDARLRTDKAAEEQILEHWVQTDPTASEARFTLAQMRFQRNGDEAALAELAELAKNGPGTSELLRVARLYDLRTDTKAAKALRTMAIERAPNEPDAWLQQAAADEEHGQFDAAEAGYRKAMVLSPNLRTPRAGLTRIRFARGDFEGALAATIQQQLEASNDNSRLAFLLERVDYLDRLGRHRESLALMQAAYPKLAPGFSLNERVQQLDGPMADAIARAEGYPASVQYIDANVVLSDSEVQNFSRLQLKLRAALACDAFDELLKAVPDLRLAYQKFANGSVALLDKTVPFYQAAVNGVTQDDLQTLQDSDAAISAAVLRGEISADQHRSLRGAILPSLITNVGATLARRWLDELLIQAPNEPMLAVFDAELLRLDGQSELAASRLEALLPIVGAADAESPLAQRYKRASGG